MTRAGADELCFLDITASHEKRDIISRRGARNGRACFMPLTVGGGVRTLDDIRKLLLAGADKVSINTAAVHNRAIRREAAEKFGSQCIVVAIDAKRVSLGASRPLGDFHPRRPQADRHRCGRIRPRGGDLGAGEILLTSMDRDGTKAGFDVELTRAIADAVSVPVIARAVSARSTIWWKAYRDGHATAVLAASIFPFRHLYDRRGKAHMARPGFPCGLTPDHPLRHDPKRPYANDRLHAGRARRHRSPSARAQRRAILHRQLIGKGMREMRQEARRRSGRDGDRRRAGRAGRYDGRGRRSALSSARAAGSSGVPLADVMAELARRTGQTGLEEKARRGIPGMQELARGQRMVQPFRKNYRPTGFHVRNGRAACRYADDADGRRKSTGCRASTTGLHRRGREHLSAAVAAAVVLCRGERRLLSRRARFLGTNDARRPSSSASPARWRSANRRRRACCKRCWRAGRQAPRSTW